VFWFTLITPALEREARDPPHRFDPTGLRRAKLY